MANEKFDPKKAEQMYEEDKLKDSMESFTIPADCMVLVGQDESLGKGQTNHDA